MSIRKKYPGAAGVFRRELLRLSGKCRYRQPLPQATVEGGVAQVEFTLDKASPPPSGDQRELGVAVSFAREGCAAAHNNLPLVLE
ncbi:MAG: hypothetical protein IT159_04370 [Bryobacterales bacterium]|nr:hypothetical protein [Bryobacterales bacterium]